jgi:hypothetical protein
MAFNRNAVKAPYLKVTRNGKTQYMKVGEMSDGEILSALARPDNAGALAPGWQMAGGQVGLIPGWSVNAHGNAVKAQSFQQQPQPKPVTSAPTPPKTAQNPVSIGGGTGAVGVGGGLGITQPPLLNPTNPITGPTTAQIAQAKLGVQTAIAPLNRQIAELQANGMGQYVSRLGVLNRDARIAKHDYNAQAAGSGLRRSGGVRTNARHVNAQADAGERDLYNTVGPGKVDALTNQKEDLVQRTVLGILGGLTGQVDYTSWGN